MASIKPLFPQVPTIVAAPSELTISTSIVLPDVPGLAIKAGDRYLLETPGLPTIETRVVTAVDATTGAERIWHLTLALV